MKIAIVGREINLRGGIAQYNAILAMYLANWGHEVHIFANKIEGLEDKNIVFHHIPMIRADFLIKKKKITWAKIFQLYSYAFLSRWLCKYNQFDIVHVSGDSFAKFDIKTAHSCHKAWLEQSKKEMKGVVEWLKKNINPLHFIVLKIEKYNYKRGNYKKIIAVSEGVKRELMEHYNLPKQDIVVIPNGVDLDRFHPKKRKLWRRKIRAELGIDEDDFVILFVGWEFKRKGLKYLLEALPLIKHNSIKLIVVGPDDPKYYKRLARSLRVLDKIIFVGKTDEIEGYYLSSDLLVFPTEYEPFGLVVIEAMAAGLPVVVSKVAGAAELIKNGENGLLLYNWREPKEIAEKVSKLISNPNLYQRIRESGRSKAEQYSWEEVARRVFQVYQKV